MPAGIQIFNDSNTIQVDERVIAFGLIASGSQAMTLDSDPHPNPMRMGNITVAGTNPVVAIQSTVPVCLYAATQSGGNWTFYFRARSGSNFSFNYWIFDSAFNAGIADPYGLAVYRADGSLAFHSSLKFMKVVDVITPSKAPTSWTGASHEGQHIDFRSYVSGRSYAVVQGGMAFSNEIYNPELDYGPLPVGQKWMENRSMHGASEVNGNLVSAGYFTFESYHNANPNSQAQDAWSVGDPIFWVIDVTGI